MLQYSQGIVQGRANGCLANDSYYSTHILTLLRAGMVPEANSNTADNRKVQSNRVSSCLLVPWPVRTNLLRLFGGFWLDWNFRLGFEIQLFPNGCR